MTATSSNITKSLASLARRAAAFVAAPASPRPLAVFRIGVCAILLVQGLALWNHLDALYGSLGIIQGPIAEVLIPAGVPRLSWVIDALTPHGISETNCIHGIFGVYLLSLFGLLLGWRTRFMAPLAWLIHLMLKMSGSSSAYGVEEFAHMGLFYCVFMPVGHAFSLDRRAGRVAAGATPAARLSLRVLQLHICIVYLASGVEKATGNQWWNGEAIWRAVMRQDFGRFDCSWLASAPWIAQFLCWSTLLVEVGYAFFVWPRWSRQPWAAATIGLHLGIGVMLGLWGFAAIMIVYTLAAFVISPEQRTAPRFSFSFLRRRNLLETAPS